MPQSYPTALPTTRTTGYDVVVARQSASPAVRELPAAPRANETIGVSVGALVVAGLAIGAAACGSTDDSTAP